MIVPVAMMKRYQYGRFIRILWIILFFGTLIIGGVVWTVWPETSHGWRLAVEALIVLHALYVFWSWRATFAHVTLSEEAIEIVQFGRTLRLAYEEIDAVWRGQLALVIKSEARTIFLERHIGNVFDLVAELNGHASALQMAQQSVIHQPLPQEINGRWQALLFWILLSLVMLFVGGGILWSSLGQTDYELTLRVVIGLWPFVLGIFFLYLSFDFTWCLTLLPDKIVIQHPLHKTEFETDCLRTVQLVQANASKADLEEEAVALQFTFENGRSYRITRHEMPLPLSQLLQVIVHHYQLSPSFEKLSETVHHTQFGSGSRRPFFHYLEGESNVAVHSIDEICRWLKQCQYMRDTELFDQRDFWQHPSQFEELRKGDCEDHALWAWRKLTELNILAELVVGQASWRENERSGHAWVTYEVNGRNYILEATHKRQLIYPQETAQKQYIPRFSVDQNMQTYKFLPIATGNGASEK